MKIVSVNPDGLGYKIGIKPGDRLLKINGRRVQDELDYRFRITEESLLLIIEVDGKIQQFEIEKEYDDDLGVKFEEMKIRSCANDCVFCFVDQNPPNMRDGMYFRDGDFRMSYLYGHYITMTNMGKNDLDRVVEQRLSPLYISVHVTDPVLRKKLFLYKRDDNLLDKLNFLTENKIELHTQIVLMPNINDNEYLINTIKDLYQFHPGIKTCTIVPVGLTGHRKGLFDIQAVDRSYAIKILKVLPNLRKEFPGQKSPFVLLSDEWYILSETEFPHMNDYGMIDLTENGVGQVRSFLNNFSSESKYFPESYKENKIVTIATGTLIKNTFSKKILPVLNNIKNLNVNLVSIDNNYFGKSVTISGLITGQDIIKQLKNKTLGERLWISHRILNDDGDKTLDDMTLREISESLDCKVSVSKDSFLTLLTDLKNA